VHLIGVFSRLSRDFFTDAVHSLFLRHSQVAPMLAKQIGANIKAARKARGLSLEKVAAAIDPPTSYQQLSRLEDAERPLTLEWVETNWESAERRSDGAA
jgi:ribosome-binding protein aMBF1 (putative translation factor)